MTQQQYEYIDLTGVIVPNTAVTRSEVEQEYKTAYGQDLVVTANTPQGEFITAETLARNSLARNNASLANQINPNLAGGIFLDAIMKLTGLERTPEQYSVCPGVLMTGEPGTVIPTSVTAGYNGVDFSPVSQVTLDSSGEATVDFQAVTPGAIDVPVGGLNTITSGLVGWETVTNPNVTEIGADTQSDVQARTYRNETLALQGMGLGEAIKSRLRVVPGVKSNFFLENPTNNTVVKNNVTLVPHSIWNCIDGGTDDAVANTLFNVKGGGANYNGDVEVTVIDPTYGIGYPVKFQRPDLIPVLAQVTYKANSSIADPEDVMRLAIISYANGLINGEPGFVVGASVSPFELAGAITTTQPGIYVKKLEVSYADIVDFVTTELFIEVFQKATILPSSIQFIPVT